MKRLTRPDLWFLVALLIVAGAGAVLLAQPGATRPESTELSYSRHYWQATFDALSAACGVGLLTYSFQEDYTALGRWILTAVGVLGALLFLAAVTHALRRMRPSETHGGGDARPTPRPSLPHPLLVVGAFLVAQALLVGVVLLVRLIGRSETTAPETAWSTIAAFASLGWANEAQQQATVWPLALLAWLGALGWPAWLLIIPPLSRRYVQVRSALAMFGGYAVVLLLAALLISALESPRGTGGRGAPDETLSAQPLATRYARSLVQTAAASGAGIPTESVIERDVTAGTKVTLAALLLIGGLGGSATGGAQFPLLLWALAGAAAALGWSATPRSAVSDQPFRPGSRQESAVRNPQSSIPNLQYPSAGLRADPSATLRASFAGWIHAGLACFFLLALLALTVALGLLLMENWTASRFQPPPTFADALLDACSVVAGGNLSTGLIETVTSRNLLGGIRQSASLYQYGMTWLMLAMLAGRLLPLLVLRQMSSLTAARADSV